MGPRRSRSTADKGPLDPDATALTVRTLAGSWFGAWGAFAPDHDSASARDASSYGQYPTLVSHETPFDHTRTLSSSACLWLGAGGLVHVTSVWPRLAGSGQSASPSHLIQEPADGLTVRAWSGGRATHGCNTSVATPRTVATCGVAGSAAPSVSPNAGKLPSGSPEPRQCGQAASYFAVHSGGIGLSQQGHGAERHAQQLQVERLVARRVLADHALVIDQEGQLPIEAVQRQLLVARAIGEGREEGGDLEQREVLHDPVVGREREPPGVGEQRSVPSRLLEDDAADVRGIVRSLPG